ncbi:MAG: A/G-specific adenine glycosylase [Pontimonas sp.]|nr:A/G-specific adenine glycosylase [Pontimonas sp.]
MNRVVAWFEDNKRDLPWRAPEAGPWGVLVSEVMLQQTPVARVLRVYEYWMARWPSPAHLAEESLAEVLRAWDRMGYPRRAKRLQEAAHVIVTEHGGVVPSQLEALLALPGVGDYTARAIRCFAFGIAEAVVDTNVRRVVARVQAGQGEAGPPRTVADRANVSALLETLDDTASQCVGAAGLMELGAIVCKARAPECSSCPIADLCQWRISGYPPYEGATAAKQARFEGSDRQVRGIILRELRSSDTPVPLSFLRTLWSEQEQFERALSSLLEDGLIETGPDKSAEYRISGS